MTTISTTDFVGLRQLADQWEATQKVLFAAQNRDRSKEQGADETPSQPSPVSSAWVQHMESALESLMAEMEEHIPSHPAYDFMMGVPGINRVMCCRVLGLIPMDTPEDFYSFSQLRKFAGYCPGHDKKVKGQKSPFCGRLRKALYVVSENLMRSRTLTEGKAWAPNNFYPEIYAHWREEYARRHGIGSSGKGWLKSRGIFDETIHPGYIEHAEKNGKNGKKMPIWPDGRQHLASIRKMNDVYLSHVWQEWRTNLGWEYRDFYAHEKLGHHAHYDRTDFSSVDLAARKMKK